MALSLHCKDREFTRNYDVVPNRKPQCQHESSLFLICIFAVLWSRKQPVSLSEYWIQHIKKLEVWGIRIKGNELLCLRLFIINMNTIDLRVWFILPSKTRLKQKGFLRNIHISLEMDFCGPGLKKVLVTGGIGSLALLNTERFLAKKKKTFGSKFWFKLKFILQALGVH